MDNKCIINGAKKNIEKYYEISTKKIGKGQFGKIKRAQSKINGTQVAIKIINKKKIKKSQSVEINLGNNFKREINILKYCKHPNIVKFLDIFEDDKNIYIVMEYIKHGDLFKMIQEKDDQPGKPFDENDARDIFVQILSALEYCHGNLITHRDLKVENILIARKKDINKNKKILIKIADFGFANYIKVGSLHKTFCGSIHYSAPEIILNESYNPIKADIWSIGVILYIILTGKFPWRNDEANLMDDIIKYNIQKSNRLNDSVMDLLDKIFKPPKERINIKGIKNHPWIKPYILPSYLKERKPVININSIIVKQVIDLGFDKNDVLNDVFDNKNSQTNAIYHMIYEQYEPVIDKDKKIKFYRGSSPKTRNKYGSVSDTRLVLSLEDINSRMTSPRSSSDPGRRILRKKSSRRMKSPVVLVTNSKLGKSTKTIRSTHSKRNLKQKEDFKVLDIKKPFKLPKLRRSNKGSNNNMVASY